MDKYLLWSPPTIRQLSRTGIDVFVTVHIGDEDIGKGLVEDGLLLVDKKGGRKFAKMMKEYDDSMQKAKKHHLNIWRYGDITEDDAKEFGVGVKPARWRAFLDQQNFCDFWKKVFSKIGATSILTRTSDKSSYLCKLSINFMNFINMNYSIYVVSNIPKKAF